MKKALIRAKSRTGKEVSDEHQRDSMGSMCGADYFPANLENAFYESVTMADHDRADSHRCYRRRHYSLRSGFSNTFTMDYAIKNVRPQREFERMAKNQITERKRKKMKKLLIVLLALTLYANIGWMVGSYYYNNVLTTPDEKLTTLGKIAAGGWSYISRPDGSKDNSKGSAIFLFGIIWPIGLIVITTSWIIYYIYYIGWFIFAGGAAKLLGLA